MEREVNQLLRERYGIPPAGEAPPSEADEANDTPCEIARRRRVLWQGTKDGDR